MEPDFHAEVDAAIKAYSKAAAKGGADVGKSEFDALVSLIVGYKGDVKDPHKEMLKSVFVAQQNRAEIKLLVDSKVFSNEWIVMTILFTITIAFILLTRLPEMTFLQVIPAILCAGLSMLIVILVKMSTLTHKRAKTIWLPLDKLAVRA